MENGISDQCAILMVTYNAVPNFQRLEGALNFVKYVIIVDNNSSLRIKDAIEEFSSTHPQCIPIFNDANYGISRAYNAGAKFANTMGIKWLFFLDGDADFGNQYFAESFNMLKIAQNGGINLGIICPIVADSTSLKKIRFKESFSFIRSAITSGIMINTETFFRVSGYNESIFVEAADLDFTRRVVKSGLKICRINKVLITQPFGRKVSVKRSIIVKSFDIVSNLSSLLTLRLGTLNVARSKYPLYDPSRRVQYYNNLIKSSISHRRLVLRIYSMVSNLLDSLFFKIVDTNGASNRINIDEEAE